MKPAILGLGVDPIDYSSAVSIIRDWVAHTQRPPARVVQANAYSLVVATEDPTYRNALNGADLSVPDGMPLVWLLRLKGHRVKERVYGPDLMLLLCQEAAARGWRCFLYGGKPGVPELLRDTLVARYPNLQIVGTYSPPFRELTPEEDRSICEMINKSRPDILWVGLGSPKQDLWMYEHREKLDLSVMHGVGAAFDFLTGRIPQAPRWMMNSGLEWLFRLAQEPGRLWKRYTVVNLKFMYYLVRRELLRL